MEKNGNNNKKNANCHTVIRRGESAGRKEKAKVVHVFLHIFTAGVKTIKKCKIIIKLAKHNVEQMSCTEE